MSQPLWRKQIIEKYPQDASLRIATQLYEVDKKQEVEISIFNDETQKEYYKLNLTFTFVEEQYKHKLSILSQRLDFI